MEAIKEDSLADFSRDNRILLISAMAVVTGVISAFVADWLIQLINLFTNIALFQRFSFAAVNAADEKLGAFVILVPAIGGLIIGFMARYGSEKIRGHGIPEALEAILIGRSKVGVKIALLKPLSSAISIGSGGPFGAEGPIIMTGGAFGSIFAQSFKISAAERKTLLVAGAAAGMSAIFAAPVAAVLLAVELLLFEWKPRSLVPVAVASSVAAAIRFRLLGNGPIFPVAPHALLTNHELLYAAVLGTLVGFASILATTLVYMFEDFFTNHCKIHWMWWPTLGGLGVGFGGWLDPRVLGVGYDTIHQLLLGKIIGADAMRLFIGKGIVWSLALGSGTSGGVLAPLLILGGASGAMVSGFMPGDAGIWATLGMAAMMGGTMRSPLTALIFTLELTHDIGLLPALLISSIAAYLVTVLLMRRSILTEKIARHGHHLKREYIVDPLELVRVADVMDHEVATISMNMKLTELSDRIAVNDPVVTRRHALAIVDDAGAFIGLITRSDIMSIMQECDPNGTTVIEAGHRDPIVTHPDALLREAVDLMLRNNIGRLPVVERNDPGKLLGLLGRASVMKAIRRTHEEEEIRESRWTKIETHSRF